MFLDYFDNGMLDILIETVEGHRTRKHSESSILYTPTSIPYKASGVNKAMLSY